MDRLSRDDLADEVVDILIVHVDDSILRQTVILHVHNLHAHLSTSQLLSEDGSLLYGIYLSVWVDAALKAAARISLQAMATSTLANPCWVEISTFEEHILRSLISAATLASKDTSYTHGVLNVADSQVAVAQLVLLPVESDKRSALSHSLHHDLASLDHVSIEAVERLSVSHHHIVGDVHDIVDRAQSYSGESVLEPLRTLLDLTSLHRHGTVARTSLLSQHLHVKLQVFALDLKSVGRRTVESRLISVLLQISIQVARHSPVRTSVRVVGRDVHLYDEVALQSVVLSRRRAHDSILRQHNDAVMACAYTYLVLGTYHAVRLDAAQLALLYCKLLVAIVEHTTELCHDDLLSSSHIGRATDNLLYEAIALVDRRHVHVVTIRMRLACKHLTYYKTLEAALDRLHLFYCFNLKAYAGERLAHLLCRQVKVDILLEPFVRYIHIVMS